MKLGQYGVKNYKIIVMLHGANFVHCYGRQYALSKKYHLVVPHIMGFGDEADTVFDTEACIVELVELIKGFSKKARKDFVQHMQNVKPETIRNCVNNGISFESVQGFSQVSFPIVALAGAKEQPEIIASVKRMAELNPHCQHQIWEKAGHNIPPVFAKRFNALIEEMVVGCTTSEQNIAEC